MEKKLYACWGTNKESLIFQYLTEDEAYDVDMNGSWVGMEEVDSEEEFHTLNIWNENEKTFLDKETNKIIEDFHNSNKN